MDNIISGNNIWVVEMFILISISVVSYLIGTMWFKKKNLPL